MRISLAREREIQAAIVAAAEAARCATTWTVRDHSGRYWRASCIRGRGHDGRCADQRGRRGPA